MQLSADILMQGYATGIFPMAEHRDDPEIFWVDPKRRGILPLDRFHLSRSLRKTMRRTSFTISYDQNFIGVVDCCADREETWINDEIRSLYMTLHQTNRAHSIEVWDNEDLIGGVYGVTLGAAFFGESMFSRRTNASKIALACLVDRLKSGGFQLFDTQFLTPHLASLGGVEITRGIYKKMLAKAREQSADFNVARARSPQEVVHRMTHMS